MQKILNKILLNWIKKCIKRIAHPSQVAFIPEMQVWVNIQKLTNVTIIQIGFKKPHDYINRGRKITFYSNRNPVSIHE